MVEIGKSKIVACKLTSLELQKRKAEVIAVLKSSILKRKELSNGYQYTFKGYDTILDQIINFIKGERQCCNFLSFNLSIEDAETNIQLTITGPKGAKEFINTEIEL